MDDAVTADGCPVEVYAHLPALGEPEWIDAVAPRGATILDLGAGVGRIAEPLATRRRVVAVDDSAAMLAHVRRAEPVLSRIEDLELAERFGVVLLASHLVNRPEPALRSALLRTARRHLATGGMLLLEWHPPEWFDGLAVGPHLAGRIGPVTSSLDVAAFDGRLLTAAVEYELEGRRWVQPFTAERLTEAALDEHLLRAGLQRQAVEPPRQDWVAARSTL